MKLLRFSNLCVVKRLKCCNIVKSWWFGLRVRITCVIFDRTCQEVKQGTRCLFYIEMIPKQWINKLNSSFTQYYPHCMFRSHRALPKCAALSEHWANTLNASTQTTLTARWVAFHGLTNVILVEFGSINCFGRAQRTKNHASSHEEAMLFGIHVRGLWRTSVDVRHCKKRTTTQVVNEHVSYT